MFRITQLDEPATGGVVLRLEGRLVDRFVQLLEDACQVHRRESSAPLTLDVSGVGFASQAGVELLCRLRRSGVAWKDAPPFLRTLCDQGPT